MEWNGERWILNCFVASPFKSNAKIEIKSHRHVRTYVVRTVEKRRGFCGSHQRSGRRALQKISRDISSFSPVLFLITDTRLLIIIQAEIRFLYWAFRKTQVLKSSYWAYDEVELLTDRQNSNFMRVLSCCNSLESLRKKIRPVDHANRALVFGIHPSLNRDRFACYDFQILTANVLQRATRSRRKSWPPIFLQSVLRVKLNSVVARSGDKNSNSQRSAQLLNWIYKLLLFSILPPFFITFPNKLQSIN